MPTHDTVESKFLHGPRKDDNVEDLIQDLVAERVQPSKFTPVVVAKIHGKVFMLCTAIGDEKL